MDGQGLSHEWWVGGRRMEGGRGELNCVQEVKSGHNNTEFTVLT